MGIIKVTYAFMFWLLITMQTLFSQDLDTCLSHKRAYNAGEVIELMINYKYI